jgi:hypothetical protein
MNESAKNTLLVGLPMPFVFMQEHKKSPLFCSMYALLIGRELDLFLNPTTN